MDAIKEAIKEAGRLALFGAVSLFVSNLTQSITTLPENQTTVVLTFILRIIDKWVHETDRVPMKGIVPF